MAHETIALDVDAAQSAISRLTSHLESGGALWNSNQLHETGGPNTNATADFSKALHATSEGLVYFVRAIRDDLERSREAIEHAVASLADADSINEADANTLIALLDKIAATDRPTVAVGAIIDGSASASMAAYN
jgi:hypothetical protein